MKTPDISVVMPTYNSERTLRISLESIRNQDFPQDKVEILVIDGGSSDKTLSIALAFGARVIENPRRLPEYAKVIGSRHANGKYIIFHDSDEVLMNKSSFTNKFRSFEMNGDIGSVVSTVSYTPKNYSQWCDYTNLLGDPFTAFVYRWKPETYMERFTRQYPLKYETKEIRVFLWTENKILPIIDGAGHMFLRLPIQELIDSGEIGRLAECNIRRTYSFGVTVDDPIEHYSSSSFFQILRKIHFRIINNVYNDQGAGYIKREEKIPKIYIFRKYLFILYGISFIFPLFRGITWAMQTRKIVFIAEPIFSLFTSCAIIWYMGLKVLGVKKINNQYG